MMNAACDCLLLCHCKLCSLCTAFLELLDLRMGVVDLKLDPDGRPVWLELNPQGQFLFVQGLTGLDLTAGFADFLCEEALSGAVRARGRTPG